MTANTRYCGCTGCTNEADAVIGYGPFERTVCESHVDGYTIQRRVGE